MFSDKGSIDVEKDFCLQADVDLQGCGGGVISDMLESSSNFGLTFSCDGHHPSHIHSVAKKAVLGHLTSHHLWDWLIKIV